MAAKKKTQKQKLLDGGTEEVQITGEEAATMTLEPPGDEPTPGPKPKKKTGRKRGRHGRYLLFDDGHGNYRIYCIADDELRSQMGGAPKGTLIPVPDVPGFDTSQKAVTFMRQSGDKFEGMSCMILKGIHIVRPTINPKPTVELKFKPRKLVTD